LLLTLLVLLLLAGLPPFPTFFAKLGMLSQAYRRGGWGVVLLLLAVIGVGWFVYVGAMLTLTGGSGLVLCPTWFATTPRKGLLIGLCLFLIV